MGRQTMEIGYVSAELPQAVIDLGELSGNCERIKNELQIVWRRSDAAEFQMRMMYYE
jgi:hypothetical protein